MLIALDLKSTPIALSVTLGRLVDCNHPLAQSLSKALFVNRDATGVCTNWKTLANTKTGETLANTQADEVLFKFRESDIGQAGLQQWRDRPRI